jgi:D-alanine-D-alanine ligase
MRVAFLYNRSSEDPAHVAEDEVPADSPVVAAIERLGHEVVPITCTLDLFAVRQQLERAEPDVVFNRVESLGGSDAMMAAVTLLLDAMQLPYTGNSTAALVGTASKLRVKEQLRDAGLPTPEWIDCGQHSDRISQAKTLAPKWIIKSVLEHASFEMDDRSVIYETSVAEIQKVIRDRGSATGREHFAEAFIGGREFNISAVGPEPRVLPPAEIDFSSFPAGKEWIVGQQAKCDSDSFEYHNTPRRFEFVASDERLLSRLRELTMDCWRLFHLSGYARVDFRIDWAGEPWILEINTNPCIMPEAGFAAALEQAGFGYSEGIELILNEAIVQNQPVPATS